MFGHLLEMLEETPAQKSLELYKHPTTTGSKEKKENI